MYCDVLGLYLERIAALNKERIRLLNPNHFQDVSKTQNVSPFDGIYYNRIS